MLLATISGVTEMPLVVSEEDIPFRLTEAARRRFLTAAEALLGRAVKSIFTAELTLPFVALTATVCPEYDDGAISVAVRTPV
jgi:hypothetical protein